MAVLRRGWELRGKDPSIVCLLAGSINFRRTVTYKSEEPVSKSRLRVCPPMLTGVRYSESYCSGVVVTVPSLAAAALMTSSGAVPLYLPYACSTAAGPLLMKGLGTD